MLDWVRFTALMTWACVVPLTPIISVQATEQVETLISEARKVGTHAIWDGDSTADIHRHCPGFLEPLAERGVRGGFTQQCEAVLDQRFFDEILAWTPIYAKDSTLTWRYVFDDPLTKRGIVLDTLGDPECMISSDQPVEDELAVRCNAAVIADYAAFKYECTGGLPSILRFIEDGFKVPSYLSDFDRINDNDSYWEKRWALEYGFLRQAWIAAKCAAIPNEALVSLDVIENSMQLKGRPEPGEEDWWLAEQAFEAYQLMGIADQLSSNLDRAEYGYERKTLSSWQRINPITAELIKIKNPGDFPSNAEEKAARLKHFIAASTWMNMKKMNVSQDWLLKQVGEFSNDEFKQAADEAIAMMTKQGVGETWF